MINCDIYVDKYTPKTLNSIIGNVNIMNKLKVLKNRTHIPNIIIHGDTGVGKTSSMLCFLKEYIKDGDLGHSVLELNASDDLRKIDIIKKKIISFIEKKNNHNIVLLDEFDNMMPQTQYILRSLIDNYPKARFILICNNLNNIIESIKSRCLILKYDLIDENSMKNGLKQIIENENISITDEAISTIIKLSNGDYRKAINDLQTVYTRFYKKEITGKDVYIMLDNPHTTLIKNILMKCINKDNIREILRDILNINKKKGYTLIDVINTMSDECQKLNIDDELKNDYIEKISEYHIKIIGGINTITQITGLVSELCIISNNKF